MIDEKVLVQGGSKQNDYKFGEGDLKSKLYANANLYKSMKEKRKNKEETTAERERKYLDLTTGKSYDKYGTELDSKIEKSVHKSEFENLLSFN